MLLLLLFQAWSRGEKVSPIERERVILSDRPLPNAASSTSVPRSILTRPVWQETVESPPLI